MGIFRNRYTQDFTILPNSAIRDKRLSLKARGLHHLMLSYPADWDIHIEHLVRECDKDGRAAIASAIQELQEAGYITRQLKRGNGGKLCGWEYDVFDAPNAQQEGISAELPKTACGQTEISSTESGKSQGGDRLQENRKRLNRKRITDDIQSTNSTKNCFNEELYSPLTPQGESQLESVKVEILEPEPEAASTQPAESGQSSEALTNQQEALSKTKSSAAAKNTRSQKKPSAAECEEARQIYNECRPDNGSWARCDVMNADRINVFTRLWVDAAQQGRDWRDILRDALAFAKLDDWWSDSAKCFEFSTLFHKRNYQKFSEKLAAKGAIASRVHESGMSTEDINLAKKIAEDRALCERLGVEYY